MNTDFKTAAVCMLVMFIIIFLFAQNGFGAKCEKLFPNDEKLRMFCVDRMADGESAEQVYENLSKAGALE